MRLQLMGRCQALRGKSLKIDSLVASRLADLLGLCKESNLTLNYKNMFALSLKIHVINKCDVYFAIIFAVVRSL